MKYIYFIIQPLKNLKPISTIFILQRSPSCHILSITMKREERVGKRKAGTWYWQTNIEDDHFFLISQFQQLVVYCFMMYKTFIHRYIQYNITTITILSFVKNNNKIRIIIQLHVSCPDQPPWSCYDPSVRCLLQVIWNINSYSVCILGRRK